MSEKAPQDLSEWHNGKLTRISDIAKAQLVAQAMKPYEDESAALRYVAEKAMVKPYMAESEPLSDDEYGEIDITDLDSDMRDGRLSDDPLTKAHDWQSALITLHEDQETQDNKVTAHQIASMIDVNNEMADNAAEVVADAYDKLEATKR